MLLEIKRGFQNTKLQMPEMRENMAGMASTGYLSGLRWQVRRG